MTPLERAKAFVQSRAAKTALKILPLALATVVGVSTKVYADTNPPAFTGTAIQWFLPSCSGGSCLDNVTASSGFTNLSNGAIRGDGFLDGVHGGGDGLVDMEFFMSGGGTGNFVDPFVSLKWNFEMECIGLNGGDCDSTDTFNYVVNATVNGSTFSFADSFTPGTLVDPIHLIPVNPGDAVGPWQITLDFLWSGLDGEHATFDPVNATLTPGVVTTPEPGTMFLAFAGLPFLYQKVRRKR